MNNILTDRELKVVSLRFGLLDANGMFTKLGNIGRKWIDLEQEYKEKVRRIHQSEIDTQNRINSAKEGIGE